MPAPGRASAVVPQRLVLAQREQDPVLGRVVPDVDAHVDDAAQALEDADRRAGVDVLGEDLAGGRRRRACRRAAAAARAAAAGRGARLGGT